MAQNTSHAVMAQRVEPADSLDFFPTPPWATRALCEEMAFDYADEPPKGVWEPACGMGHMARPLAEYFETVHASDVHDYGFGEVDDFLFPGTERKADWIITNPPFKLAEQFAATAIKRADVGVALLVRTTFLEGVGRWERLFNVHKPGYVFQFSERVPMHKGRLLKDGSTATAYAWIVWIKSKYTYDTQFGWIPPSRKRLERAEDYA